MSNELLHSRIVKRFNDVFETPPDVPKYIYDNLNHNLRPYQEEAIRHYIYTQRSGINEDFFNHLLFHMATGSGKTNILAAVILYLYKEKHMQDFIFFVNSDAVIRKTLENLTNKNSSKYLFNKSGILIEGNLISIQIVDNFPVNKDPLTIYLKLTTIQKLHIDLTFPRENSICYKDFVENPICLLADEAHHINAYTRSEKKGLSKAELEEKTWETTVQQILKSNIKNKLVEFTATVNLTNESLFNKYRDKIVFQYDLRKFMEDGYSKNVVLLKANQDDEIKVISAVLLSQYRKYIARDHSIDIKPIILFKSNKIDQSLKANHDFNALIDQMNLESLKEIISNGYKTYLGTDTIFEKMFKYYSTMDLNRVLKDLKWDFEVGNIINANDKSFISEKNAVLLNSLEELDNPIRAIFAVAKLNEGWDVLNLFDIVRLSEGVPISKSITDSEAQLIGRGARFNPYNFNKKLVGTRQFDLSSSNLKILETMHYHTINDNAYIKNLEKSLEAANIEFYSDSYHRLKATLKASFKKTNFYRNGYIYINKVQTTLAEDYQCLNDYGIPDKYFYKWERSSEQLLGQKDNDLIKFSDYKLPYNEILIRKAIRLNPFFRYDRLKKYVPSISTIEEFIQSPKYLRGQEVYVSLPENLSIESLSNLDKIKILNGFLDSIERNIKNNYKKEKGTTTFEPIKVSTVIDDYVIELSAGDKKISSLIKSRNMAKEDWFVYDVALVNSLEEQLLEFIYNRVDELKQRYNEVYLIRNERKIKLTEFDSYKGFMPDFILFLKDAKFNYFIFIEPKGSHLIEKDQWKQEMLKQINDRTDIEILGQNKNVIIKGLKFYNSDELIYREFLDDFNSKIFM